MTITLASHDELHNLHNLIETAPLTPEPTEADNLKAQLHGLQQANESLRFELAQAKESLMEMGNELTKAWAKLEEPLHPTPLMQALQALIQEGVTRALSDAATTKSLLSAISTEHEEKIREIALEVMQEHNDEFDHDQYDQYDRTLDDLNREIEDKVSRDDVPSRSEIEEMVSDAVDNLDLTDQISDAVESYMADATITISK